MPKIKNFRQPPDLAKLEEEVLAFWKKNHTFEKSVQQRSKDNAYVFYDGPPFATGMPHYGSLLSSIAKDVFPRYQTMKGKRVERVWGWDCHGLPIENMIEKELKIQGGKKGIEKLGIAKFNQACRNEVLRLDQEWEKIVNRIGRWVDFKHNYKTMDKTYMESVWWGFKQLYDQNLIYEGKKVILYCPRCATPLSNFEIAMDNSYEDITERSMIGKYQVKNQPKTYLLAWSTTPWNKLATPALAVNSNLKYVKVKQGDEFYILAKSTLSKLKKQEFDILDEYLGEDLTKLEFEPHYDFYPARNKNERIGVVIADDFVTSEEGTGIVTLAVYGEEDLRVMKKHHIQLVEHVNDEGKLKKEVQPWAGMDILTVNPLVLADLEKRNLLYHQEDYHHSVPVCYRCATRLYYAPIPAWFIDIKKLRSKLIKENEKINWYPAHLKYGRFKKGLETAPDWNISRSRYWGTPMPIWQKTIQGKILRRVIGSLAELKKWAVKPKEIDQLTDLHREYLDEVEVWLDDQKTIKGQKTSEVFDCWVESGSMPFASIHYPFANQKYFDQNYPAQYVSEYISQTRAWFYTMHVMSVGIFGKPPFENVLTTGVLLAADGAKLSKSKRNFTDPMVLVSQFGADSLRLYLMSSPVMKAGNVNFKDQEVAEIRRKTFIIWWNVLAFYKNFTNHANSSQKKQISILNKNIVKLIKKQDILDQWLLSYCQSLIKEVTQLMDKYDVVKSSRLLMQAVTDLSTWYLRLSRERLKDQTNQPAQTSLAYALYTLAQLFAPITPFFAELIHHNLQDDQTSIHLTDWPTTNQSLINQKLESEMIQLRKIVELAHAQRKEKGVKLRQVLASLTVKLPEVLSYEVQLTKLLLQELNVKQIKWQKGEILAVQFDFRLTSALKAEGEARELIRNIQKLRKKAGLAITDQVKVAVTSWPKQWKKQIEDKTNSCLIKGQSLKLIN